MLIIGLAVAIFAAILIAVNVPVWLAVLAGIALGVLIASVEKRRRAGRSG
jgi:hypothetical protein